MSSRAGPDAWINSRSRASIPVTFPLLGCRIRTRLGELDRFVLIAVLAAVLSNRLSPPLLRLGARGRRRSGPAEEPQPGRRTDQRAMRAAKRAALMMCREVAF
ncbi:hypothetical protein [Nonomuraea polychroma]|uniref:hypothetical protein n=1 Tax=Nonomuraea polychroma TaxID=46176 RepID=UPI000FDE4821|nr:hypothetical protein [Nonomuraea polychroma]